MKRRVFYVHGWSFVVFSLFLASLFLGGLAFLVLSYGVWAGLVGAFLVFLGLCTEVEWRR